MVFSIRQNSTQPTLKIKLLRDGRNDYNQFDDRIENSVATFAMRDSKTGIYKIANKEAKVVLRDPCSENDKSEYLITYEFTNSDTNQTGIFIGEFKITFLDNTIKPYGELIVPIREQLYIHVLESFVKSDITFF
jgi:hypothetical protein